jgi:hypothetical protein
MNLMLKTGLRALGFDPDSLEVRRSIAVLKDVFARPGAGTWSGALEVALSRLTVADIAAGLPGELRPADPLAWAAAFGDAIKANPSQAKALYSLRSQL